MNPDERALTDQSGYYDSRYRAGYMQDFTGFYEACRVRTMRETLSRLDMRPRRILDYGCGEGRYLDVLRERFPGAQIVGADVSRVGLAISAETRPWAQYRTIDGVASIAEPDGSFDLITSVEVLEHVADVKATIAEMARLTAPGGTVVVTTPCANPWSVEWIAMKLTGGLQRSKDGYGRFASDEPGHLRRLTSDQLTQLLGEAGLGTTQSFFRGQVFAYPLSFRFVNLLPDRVRVAIGMLDWRLFKHRPNGSTVLMVAKKRAAREGPAPASQK
jgi:SAM-dependent methyltransferase